MPQAQPTRKKLSALIKLHTYLSAAITKIECNLVLLLEYIVDVEEYEMKNEETYQKKVLSKAQLDKGMIQMLKLPIRLKTDPCLTRGHHTRRGHETGGSLQFSARKVEADLAQFLVEQR